AHDLKSPLNSLTGLIKLIKDDNLTKEEFSEYIPIISQNLGYNKILLENLLIWSRSQLKGLELNEKVFDLRELIQCNIDMLYHSGYYKGQVLINEIQGDTMAYADKAMIEMVIRNLLTNSLKFTKENHRISVSASNKGDKLLIKVSDQGVGIKKENLDKIFANEFFTTPGTHLETGTGIGLFLAKELVEFNKGSIWVESEFGLGTDFYFEIPKA
ncbi:MAG: HAMP domain-containing histidine kinase, partial [Cyclobacteriaceae bacterium]|nr:HAMP domain-containing histidine kinase [Cyclobacteriaceae bacterium]